MDVTIRKTKGFKVDPDGTKVRLVVETVEGDTAVIELVAEAALQMVLDLMNARSQAIFRAEGDIPSDVSEDGRFMREAIPADRLEVSSVPGSRFCLVEVATPLGAVFEFRFPRENLPLRFLSEQ